MPISAWRAARLRRPVAVAPSASGRWKSRIAAALVALPVVAAAAFLVWQSIDRDPPTARDTAPASSKGPSIAVLPLENASGDPEQEYSSNGLTEEIITELTRFPDLFVFYDHYGNGRYEAALAETQRMDFTDYRAYVYLAATYAQLGRLAEARRAVEEMHEQWPDLPDDMRRDLIERHGIAPELTDQLLAGLAKAGKDNGL